MGTHDRSEMRFLEQAARPRQLKSSGPRSLRTWAPEGAGRKQRTAGPREVLWAPPRLLPRGRSLAPESLSGLQRLSQGSSSPQHRNIDVISDDPPGTQ